MISTLSLGGLGLIASPSGTPPASGLIWTEAGTGAAISGGGLVGTLTSTVSVRAGTAGKSSGVHQFEITITAAINCMVGIGTAAASLSQYPGRNLNSYGYYAANGNKFLNEVSGAYGASYTAGDVIGVVLDFTAGALTFYKNGSSQGTAYSSISGTFFPMFGKAAGAGTNSIGAINSTLIYPVGGATQWVP